ncbi:MAG: peptidoglycan DD-metalloendopeptidase family protein [Propionibacteriaceae bacterium]|jgi:murein DD-endopeptidase MepM/ murein hydrolase activator NlpD|nr:peptidoglycan DD-metalloendopeptidase family protein [Propionibacteriaceae bacterium]
MSALTPLRRLALIGSTVVLTLGMTVASARADAIDDLNAHKDQIKSAISDAQSNVNQSSADVDAAKAKVADSSARVSTAQGLVADAQTRVDTAQAALDQAEADVSAAQAVEAQKAAELDTANQVLVAAKDKEAKGEAAIAAQKGAINAYARSILQDNMPMVNVAVLFNGGTTASLANRVQWSDTVLATNQVDLDQLRQLQEDLVADRQASQDAQLKADQAKQAADQQVLATQSAQDKAQTARDGLQAALDQQQVALGEQQAALAADQSVQAGAEQDLSTDQAALAALQAESANVDAQIAEAVRQAEAAARAAQDAANSGGSSGGSAPAAQSGGLIWPVDGVITDYYGWRTHPVWGTQLFHDGLDIGASCGKPIYAPASGQVTDEYYSSGYGYRLFIDHGVVGGSYLTTSYNHMSGYAVPSGTWVSQGQVVGYVGTTGVSTGCHLHFMVWDNGTKTNPLSYLP